MVKQKTSWKGKTWYTLIAPKMFGEFVIGETPVSDPKNLTGRAVEVSAMDLIKNTPKYYFTIFLKYDKVSDQKIQTKYVGQECARDFITRMVRRGARRIDNREILTTKDGRKIIVKTVSITLKRTTTSIKESVRCQISQTLKKLVEKKNLEEFIKDTFSGAAQKIIQKEATKQYPVRQVEIRKIEVLD
jgi:small subunit ribosomal protein S3Ae